MPLPKVKISISDAYFSDAQTMADFFNRIGQERTVSTGWNRWSKPQQTGCYIQWACPLTMLTDQRRCAEGSHDWFTPRYAEPLRPDWFWG